MDHEFSHASMAAHPDDLTVAYKKEKDTAALKRILAVRLVLEDDKEVWEAASIVYCSEDSVRNWIQRFREAGVRGLRDLSPSDDPPAA